MNISNVENFCKDPNINIFSSLPHNLQLYLKTMADYCIKKNIGNEQLAIDIRSMYFEQTIREDTKRGLLALFSAIETIDQLQTDQKLDGFPKICLKFLEKDSYITITPYAKQPNNMYTVLLDNIDNEMNFSFEFTLNYLIDYFLEFFNYHRELDIPFIYFQYNSYSADRVFYDKRVGVVYGYTKCYKCRLQEISGQTLTTECTKLLKEDDCTQHIMHRKIN